MGNEGNFLINHMIPVMSRRFWASSPYREAGNDLKNLKTSTVSGNVLKLHIPGKHFYIYLFLHAFE